MHSTRPMTEEREALPRTGKVNEMCREWLVREDGALAYRLQNEEISEHYQGNRYRNAVVREDFPRAVDEQIREQQLAEQAAAVYHQMLAEQEEIDKMYAKEVADELERDQKVRNVTNGHKASVSHSRETFHAPLVGIPKKRIERMNEDVQRVNTVEGKSPRRKALAMPLPEEVLPSSMNEPPTTQPPENYLYVEPYKTHDETLPDRFNRIDLADEVTPNEISERERQEQKDAELARKLQEQEDCSEESIINRDRMLAIEAQDKELAKLLQEKERQKIKRAKERAKQKALAKKQQMEQEKAHQIMPDDSYSNPADLLPTPEYQYYPQSSQQRNPEDDLNYSLPVNVLHGKSSKTSPRKVNNGEIPVPATRPTQLDLKAPLNRPSKFRHDGEMSESTLSSPHKNIAIAIDPTYNRRSQHITPNFDTSSSTVTTSTSSSSPGIILPTPDLAELEDSPAPPYMPIQGQRRTASLEKKQKKKAKDGCKQQ